MSELGNSAAQYRDFQKWADRASDTEIEDAARLARIQNIQPRRFEPNFSTDFESIRYFLEKHGYQLIHLKPSGFGLAEAKGRPRKVSWPAVIDLVDSIRTTAGLEPIRRVV